jgi:hypothetical protein
MTGAGSILQSLCCIWDAYGRKLSRALYGTGTTRGRGSEGGPCCSSWGSVVTNFEGVDVHWQRCAVLCRR